MFVLDSNLILTLPTDSSPYLRRWMLSCAWGVSSRYNVKLVILTAAWYYSLIDVLELCVRVRPYAPRFWGNRVTEPHSQLLHIIYSHIGENLLILQDDAVRVVMIVCSVMTQPFRAPVW